MNADIPNDDLGPREPGIDQFISAQSDMTDERFLLGHGS